MPKIIQLEISISTSPASQSVPLVLEDIINPAGGNPMELDALPTYEVLVTGSHTLAGAHNVTAPISATKGMLIKFIYKADVVSDAATGKVLNIFGYQFSDTQANKNGTLECYFNGVAWEVWYVPSFSETGFIEESYFKDETIPSGAFKDQSIPSRAFADGTIPGTAHQNATIPGSKLQDQAVGNTKMADGAVGTSKVTDRAITNDKLNFMAAGTVKGGDGSNLPVDIQMNDTGVSGAMLLSQGYGLKALPKNMAQMGRLDKDGNFFLVAGSVGNAYLGTYAVSASKADDTMASDLITKDVDLTEHSYNRTRMAYKGKVVTIMATVDKAISGGDCTITVKNEDDTVLGTFSIPNGTSVNDSFVLDLSAAASTFEKYDDWKFESSGSTGGKVGLSIIVTKVE